MLSEGKLEELKPCPFCGCRAKLRTSRVAEDAEEAWVECNACEVATCRFEDAYAPTAQACDAWNTRTEDARIKVAEDELAALRAQAPAPVCQTCEGRGEIGGWVGQTAESGGYETEPCPDCTPSPAPVGGEVVNRMRLFCEPGEEVEYDAAVAIARAENDALLEAEKPLAALSPDPTEGGEQ